MFCPSMHCPLYCSKFPELKQSKQYSYFRCLWTKAKYNDVSFCLVNERNTSVQPKLAVTYLSETHNWPTLKPKKPWFRPNLSQRWAKYELKMSQIWAKDELNLRHEIRACLSQAKAKYQPDLRHKIRPAGSQSWGNFEFGQVESNFEPILCLSR